MIKKISYIFVQLLYFIDQLFFIIFKKNFLGQISVFIQEKTYKTIRILNRDIKFFVPNYLLDFRVKTFFTKEPETLEWIDSFENKNNLIFWDIGANIGLYSIYNVLKNPNSVSIAFEPSSSNLRILTRNISINELDKKIKVVPMPLSNKKNTFQNMNEKNFIEGMALNTFGENFDFEGKKFKPKMKYTILGTTINNLIENGTLEIPDYIKIDVDGIEHLIIEGGNKFLGNKKIKSISVEINENFKEQYEKVFDLMKKNNFKLLYKKHNKDLHKKHNKDFHFTYNFIFSR